MAYLNTHPFGPRRAPPDWAMVEQFAVFVLKHVFRTWVGLYLDDLVFPEPESTIEPARRVIGEIGRLLGYDLDPDKEIAPAISTMPIGAKIKSPPGFDRASIPWSKASMAIEEIKEILKANTIPTSQASTLSGELGLVQYLPFGLLGRAMVKPLDGRQYATTRRRAPLVTSLRIAITFRASPLMNPKPRLVPLRPIKPCVIYTDACGEWNLFAVLCYPVEVESRGHSPIRRNPDAMGYLRMGDVRIPTWHIHSSEIYKTHTGHSIRS